MATQQAILEYASRNEHVPPGIPSLQGELSPSGQLRDERIRLAIDDTAPKPGLLVYVVARKLAMPLNGLDTVLFSAIDISTQLQVAQAYHSLTTASAVSFVEFVAESFPFPISRIRTSSERPFLNGLKEASQRDFSVLIGRLGYIHSPIADPARDAFSSITSKLLFQGVSDGCFMHASAHDLQRELNQFLFFHNNYRSIPWLGGKAPLQRLKMFDGFSSLHVFNMVDGLDKVQASAVGRSAGGTGKSRTAVGASGTQSSY